MLFYFTQVLCIVILVPLIIGLCDFTGTLLCYRIFLTLFYFLFFNWLAKRWIDTASTMPAEST
jgi:hypothetical protein